MKLGGGRGGLRLIFNNHLPGFVYESPCPILPYHGQAVVEFVCPVKSTRYGHLAGFVNITRLIAVRNAGQALAEYGGTYIPDYHPPGLVNETISF